MREQQQHHTHALGPKNITTTKNRSQKREPTWGYIICLQEQGSAEQREKPRQNPECKTRYKKRERSVGLGSERVEKEAIADLKRETGRGRGSGEYGCMWR